MSVARLPLVDLLRGGALWAMVVFHTVWDLGHFGWIDADFPFTPGFVWFGHAIAASFLLLAGASLVLARRSKGVLWRSPAFWRRWVTVAAAAAAVSAVSFALFPDSPIFFGILHCIALATLLAAPLVDAPLVVSLALAALAFAAPHFFASPAFDAKPFWWTGLSTLTPASNDWQPFFPWGGFVFLGVALGRLPLPARGARESRSALPRALRFCGRHSLAFYLIHQPVLFGLFAVLALIAPPAPDEGAFMRACSVQCVNQGSEAGLCERSCACIVARAKEQGFWPELAQGQATPQVKAQTHDAAVACYADSAR